jgi:hypothetical protein
MLPVDADCHFFEPLDLVERYIDSRFRERAYRVEKDAGTGKLRLVLDQRPLQLVDVEELPGAVVGYGEKEFGRDLSNFDCELPLSGDWQDMDKRIEFLDREGLAAQVIHPTVGSLWEDTVTDPLLADALCRAYNTCAMETCAAHRDCLGW